MASHGRGAVFSHPRHGRLARAAALALLMWLAFVLRHLVAIDGVLDVDALNFALSAERFDVLLHQPHPPGYPGYVVWLKLLRALAPGLEPLALARLGTVICGVLVVPATYWACQQLLGGARGRVVPFGRPVVAAGFAVVHPILWYYGGDGQSHAAEALLVVLLFGAAVAVRRAPSRRRLLLLAIAFGLAGSVRPTVSLLTSPALVWALWGRPWRDWIWAGMAGAATVLAWLVPLVALSGGWALYRRASQALVGQIFVANYSVLGERASAGKVLFNVAVTLVSAALALLPVVAVGRLRGHAWMRPAVLVVAASVVFYALLFLSETGYVAGVSALACLVPATWPEKPPALARARAALVPVAALGFIALAPAHLAVSGRLGVFLPSYSHVYETHQMQRIYREMVCGAARGEPALVISDTPFLTHLRWVALSCPGVTSALYLGNFPLGPVDAWMIWTGTRFDVVPGPVPWEAGPAEVFVVPAAARVIAAIDSSDAFVRELADAARCAPEQYAPEGVDPALAVPVWPARCLPAVHIGAHVLELPEAR